MAKATDFILDEDGDIFINPVTGDLDIGLSDKQHIKDIINANIGYYKQFPLVGVGVFNYINSGGDDQKLERTIKIQLVSDGYSVDRPKVSRDPDGTLNIQPNAQRL